MELLLVRHGQSVGNAEGFLQGQSDYPLTEQGRGQARALARWLARIGLRIDAAVTSPQSRAVQTAEILTAELGLESALLDPDLRELHAGQLQGVRRRLLEQQDHPFFRRPFTEQGDYSRYGGESYDEVQQRVARLCDRYAPAPPEGAPIESGRILVVAHGGILFQFIKALTTIPVPRIANLKIGNCAATLVRLVDRRGTFIGEVAFHLPVELMGDGSDAAAFFDRDRRDAGP